MRRLLMLLLVTVFCAGIILAAGHGEYTKDEADHVQLWKTFNFVILAVGLGWATRKYAGAYFRGRTRDIQQDIVEARKLKEEAEAKAAEMERRMANLDTDVKQLQETAKSELAAEEVRLKVATEQSIARMKTNAEQEIASATKHAQKELKAFAGELALDLARQKLRDRMTSEVSSKLIDSFVDDLPGRVN